jgi:hypothetical protein
MNPAVFLTKPGDGGVKAFIKNARPSIRSWVANHYEHFRMQCPAPRDAFFGAHQVHGGWLLAYHLYGEYNAVRGARLTSTNYPALPEEVQMYPRMNANFNTWVESFPRRTRALFLNGTVQPALALSGDLASGGLSSYYILPSLAKMLADNLRLGVATPQQLANFMAKTLMSYDSEQGKAEGMNVRKKPNVFNTTRMTIRGEEKEVYSVFHILEDLINRHPQQADAAAAMGLGAFPLETEAAARILSVYDDDGDLEPFRNIPNGKFEGAVKKFIEGILNELEAPFPVGQVVRPLSTIEAKAFRRFTKDGKTVEKNLQYNDLPEDVREGEWRVLRAFRGKKRKPLIEVQSQVNNEYRFKGANPDFFVVLGEDLRRSFDVSNSRALPSLEIVFEAFLYLDHINSLCFSNLRHDRFTRDHFLRIDKIQDSQFDGDKKKATYYGEWFIDARADQMVAFYANLWAEKKEMRKSLESLFTGDTFALAEVSWYTELIGKYMSPALVPQMQQAGVPVQMEYQPDTATFVSLSERVVDLKLEAPLLRDAYLAYMTEFNQWFSQVLIGVNRGFLYEQPYGPEGPGGDAKKAKKAVKSARESFRGAITEAWGQVRGSASSLRGVGVPEERIVGVIQERVRAAHEALGFSRPSLPPAGFINLDEYLKFVSNQFAEDPVVLSAVSTALVRLHIDTVSDINEVEKMFISDIKKHMQMRALGVVRFPALATALNVLRGYIVVPADQLNEFVATQLTGDIQALVRARAQQPGAFTTRPEPAIVAPSAPATVTPRVVP